MQKRYSAALRQRAGLLLRKYDAEYAEKCVEEKTRMITQLCAAMVHGSPPPPSLKVVAKKDWFVSQASHP